MTHRRLCQSLTQANRNVYDMTCNFYQEATGYLATKLPIGITLLKNTECLHPEVREQEGGSKLLSRLAESLPGISKEEIPLIRDEWKVYKGEKVPDEKIYDDKEDLRRIDHYWSYVLSLKTSSGRLKYKHLKKLVMTCLCLCHGNADVERSLSVIKKTVNK